MLQPVWGYLADRVRRKKYLMFAGGEVRILTIVSEFSSRSIEQAVKLAKLARGSLVFMYILKKGVVGGRRACLDALVPAGEGAQVHTPFPGLFKRLTVTAFEKLEECLELAGREGVEARVMVCEGEYASTIVEEAGKGHDMIVLPYVKLDKPLRDVLERVAVPILLVREA